MVTSGKAKQGGGKEVWPAPKRITQGELEAVRRAWVVIHDVGLRLHRGAAVEPGRLTIEELELTRGSRARLSPGSLPFFLKKSETGALFFSPTVVIE